jgi:quinol monooxygenase YgiN
MWSMQGAFIVIAEFAVSAENRAEFLELCVFDSVRSVEDEVGCEQFDVVTAEETPEVVILYEVYADRAAFDTHQTMPHYAVFKAGVERLGVTATLVRFMSRHHH